MTTGIENLQLAGVTDFAVCKGHPDRSLKFPGPARVDAELVEYCARLAQMSEGTAKEDFTLNVDGTFWRGHADTTVVDGVWYRLRKLPSNPPHLESLPSPMPGKIVNALLSDEITRGGLVLCAGGTGCGKTTTASAMVVSRLKKFGGMAYTVEDPPEHPLNGWHGEGYCAQTAVVTQDEDAPWAKALKGVLRSQPSATPTLLFVGEIREREAAAIALQAAANGFTVVTTSFASSATGAIEAFAQLLNQEAINLFAQQLRAVLYQEINGEAFTARLMVSHPSSQVASIIRKGAFAQLENEAAFQANALRLHDDIWDATRS